MRESEMEGFVVFSWVGFHNPFVYTIVDRHGCFGRVIVIFVFFRQTKRSGGDRNDTQVSCQVNNWK